MDTVTPTPPVPNPIDASQYIRTYAKDFAAVSGRAPAAPSKQGKPPKAPKIKQPKPKKEKKIKAPKLAPAIEEAPTQDFSILEQQTETPETLVVTAVAEPVAEVIPAPEPALVEAPVQEPIPVQQETVPAAVAAPRESLDRVAILQQLKEKAQISVDQSQNEFRPVEFHSVSDDFRLPGAEINQLAPEPAKPPVSIEEALPLPRSEEAAASIVPVVPETPQPVAVSVAAPLHTYKSDFSEHIDAQGANAFSVLAADKDAGPTQTVVLPERKASVLPLVIGGVLLVLGFGALSVLYVVFSARGPVSLAPNTVSFIAPDKILKLPSGDLLQELASQAIQPLPLNSIEEIILPGVATSTDLNVLNVLAINAPDILTRNTDPSSIVGIVHAAGETKPFFVLRVTSYERTFAGMLSWESTMSQDLAALFPTEVTGTTSFTDEVVSNHNARVLKDAAGNSILIYGYADQQTLIIARDEAAFQLLLSRVQATNS